MLLLSQFFLHHIRQLSKTTSLPFNSNLPSRARSSPTIPSTSYILKGIPTSPFLKHTGKTKLTQSHSSKIMSSVDALADNMATTSIAPVAPEGANNITGGQPINAAENEAVIAAAAEGRRLYIGNLAYATTEGDLKSFFTGYSVYVLLHWS